MRILIVSAFLLYVLPVFSQDSIRVDSLLEGAASQERRAKVYLRLSRSFMGKNTAQAEKYARESLVLARQSNNTAAEVEALLILGDIKQYSQPLEGLKHYLEAEEVLGEIEKNPRLYIELLSKLATFYSSWQEYDKALQYVEERQRLIEKYALQQRVLPLYELLGDIYASQGKAREAVAYYRKEIQSRVKFEKRKRIPGIYSSIGNTYFRQQQYDSARYYYLKGLQEAKKEQSQYDFGYLKDNIGLSFFKEARYDSALFWQRQGLSHRRKSKSRVAIAVSLSNLAQTHLKNGMPDSAVALGLMAYPIALQADKWSLLQKVSEGLSEGYYALCQLEEAYFYIQQAHSYQDSLKNQRSRQASIGAAARIEIEKQRFDNQILRQENQLLTGTGIAVFIALVLLLGVSVWTFQQKRLREKLLQELSELNETKNKLFSIISHDLRGPLGSLKAMLDLLLGKAITPEEFAHFSAKLQRNMTDVQFMMENLLQWAKAQQGGIRTNPETKLLRPLVETQLKALETLSERKAITITEEISDKLEVFADPHQLELILRNLIANAIKFTPAKGKIFIQAAQKGQEIEVRVRDTGIGIAPEDLPRLFQVDEYLSRLGAEGEKGTGLGLQLVREMIENNNGRLHVESQLDQGSTFFIWLPAQKD